MSRERQDANTGSVGVAVRDPERGGPLHFVSTKEEAEKAIADGASIHETDSDSNTVLHSSISRKCKEVSLFFLRQGVEVNAINAVGLSALISALDWGDLEVINALLDGGAAVQVVSPAGGCDGGNWVPLHYAAMIGDLDLCEKLIDKNAQVKKANRDGGTPLHYAAEDNRKEICRLLLEKGALIDAGVEAQKYTPLHLAALAGNVDVCGLLLEKGALIDAGVKAKKPTPLNLAAFAGNVDVCSLLLDSGALINAGVGAMEGTPLHAAVNAGSVDVYQLLLGKEARIDAKDFNGRTPLHLAVADDDASACRLLVEWGADPRLKDRWGASAIDQAGAELGCLHALADGYDPFELYKGYDSMGFFRPRGARGELVPGDVNTSPIRERAVLDGVVRNVIRGDVLVMDSRPSRS